MPISIRMDQTVTGLAKWPPSHAQVNPLTITSSNPSKLEVVKQSDGSALLLPHQVTTQDEITVTIKDSTGATASDTATVTPTLPVVGTIVWSTPTPA